MPDNKCFSSDCEIIGGGGISAELFASVAMGGAKAGRFGRERQKNNLMSFARDLASKRRDRVSRLGKTLSAFTPSLIVYFITTYVFNLVLWLSCIIMFVLFIVMCIIVWKFDFLKTIIIKITFNKRLTIKVIKKGGLSGCNKLTIDDINTVISEQYLNIISDVYGKKYADKYVYKEIKDTDLIKRKIKFSECP